MPDPQDLAALVAQATPGPWEWAAIYAHDVHALVLWLPGETFPNGDPRYVQIHSDGSAGGEYGPDIDVTGPDARLIALAPELAAEVISLRAQAAKDKARIERLEAAMRPFVAYVHYAFHEGNSRFRLVEDFDEGGGWLGSEDFRRARAALEDGE